MSTRITKADLEELVRRLNAITARPANCQFELSKAYGGYCLYLIVSDGRAVTCPIDSSHRPAGKAYQGIHTFLQGILWATHNLEQPK